ncbi:transposable element Tc1 transposase [Trichonephila clavipes]|nr:transposable element Tc1 transposase [Trichonephila clavipes]
MLKDLAGMYPLHMTLGNSVKEMVLTQEDRVPSGHLAVLRGKMAVFGDSSEPDACVPLTPSHCHLRRQWCQTRDHRRMEWRSVVFSNKSKFCLGASGGCVLVRGRPWKRLQPNCLWPKHTRPTPGVMVWGAISFNSRSTLVTISNTLTTFLRYSVNST